MNTKQLRQKILDLAIRGKLVPQDPNDEPASILLERIRAEKERLIKEAKIKRSKKDSTIVRGDDKSHYEQVDIPDSWERVELGSVCELSNGISKRKADSGSLTIVLRLADLGEEDISLASTRSINLTEKEVDQYKLYCGDLLFVRVNGSKPNVGKTYVYRNDETAAFCDHLMRGRVSKAVDSDYLRLALRSTEYRNAIDKLIVTTAGQNTISQGSLNSIIFPLPPLLEQHRITAAVVAAFAVIDEIEAAKDDLQTAVAAAKRKILSLAIRGKLVPQDPADEPASLLFERIRPSQAKSGRKPSKKGASAALRSDDNSYFGKVPFEVPESWCYAQLESLVAPGQNSFADGPFGSKLKTDHYTLKPEVRIIQLSNIGESGWRDDNKRYTTFAHAGTISRSKVSPGDIVIAKMMPAGRAIEVPDKDKNYILSSDAIKFVPSKRVNKRFLLYAINSSFVNEQILNEVQGIGRVRTSLGKMKKYIIPLPPSNEQQRIVETLDAVFEQLDSIAAMLA